MNEQIVLGETSEGKPVCLPFSLCRGKHWLIRGKTGSGKSLLLGSLLGQLAKVPEVALFVCDLSGDPFVFHYLKDMPLHRRFGPFSLDEDDGFFHFDPMQSLRALKGSKARKANYLGASLSLLHAEGYGTGYYARVNLSTLLVALMHLEDRGIENPTLAEVGEELARMARTQKRSKDASEALFALEQLLCYPQFAALEDPNRNIDIDRAIDHCECVYFLLPSLLEPLTL